MFPFLLYEKPHVWKFPFWRVPCDVANNHRAFRGESFLVRVILKIGGCLTPKIVFASSYFPIHSIFWKLVQVLVWFELNFLIGLYLPKWSEPKPHSTAGALKHTNEVNQLAQLRAVCCSRLSSVPSGCISPLKHTSEHYAAKFAKNIVGSK